MNDMSDGLNFAPRVREPETALMPGMAAPAPRNAVDALLGPDAQSMPDTSGPGPTPVQAPASWQYDFDPASGISRATFNGEVSFTSGGSGAAGVTSWNTRTGAVSLTLADVTGVGGAPANSPTFINPNANTPPPGDATTKLATTLFVSTAVASNPAVSSFNGRQGAVTLTTGDITGAGGAPVDSPALTGSPTAPTPAQGDADSSIATTMFVSNAIGSGAVTSWNGRKGGVTLSLSDVTSVGGAPIASPSFTGAPTGPTPTVGDATTKLATTAFVTNAVSGATAGVASWNTRTGAVTLTLADVTGVGGAPLLSPTFTGTPQAPTPTGGDSSTKIATTAFVGTAIASLPAGVATFNGRSGTVVQTLTDITSVGGAPVASPTFTGTPITTTPTPGDNSTRIASTAFVAAAVAPLAQASSVPVKTALTPVINGTAAIGNDTGFAVGNHVHPTDTTRAALAGATFTGLVTLPTLTCTGGATFAGSVSNSGGIINVWGAANTQFGFYDATGTTQKGAVFWDQAANAVRVRHTASGSDLIIDASSNVTATGGSFIAKGGAFNAWSAGNPQHGLVNNTGTQTGAVYYFASGGTIRMQQMASNGWAQVDGGGNFSVSGSPFCPAGGAWNASSDARIKTVHGAYPNGLDQILQLRPVVYTYKGNDTPTAELHAAQPDGIETVPHAKGALPYPGSVHYQTASKQERLAGLVAQELEAIFPDMVTEVPGFIDGEATAIKHVNPSNLVYALINAVQTLAARVEALEATQ
jgi:Chaperone of endosialidase